MAVPCTSTAPFLDIYLPGISLLGEDTLDVLQMDIEVVAICLSLAGLLWDGASFVCTPCFSVEGAMLRQPSIVGCRAAGVREQHAQHSPVPAALRRSRGWEL